MTRTSRRLPRRPRPYATRTWLAGAGLVGASVASAAATTPAAWSAEPAPSAPSARSTLSGSIVFIKAHNVWLANGDGSGQYQVTTNGTAANPWLSPTQSDTGVIAASRFHDIVVMSQNGTVRATINPASLPDSVGRAIDGAPQDLAISPDGTKIAYTFYMGGCPIGTSCGIRTATGVTSSAALTPYQTYGATFLATPSWIGNSRTLQSGGNGSHMKLKDPGVADKLWFNDFDYADPSTDLGDAEVSPNGKWLAAVRGYSDNAHIMWYSVTGDVSTGRPPAVPDPECATDPLEGFADPTWAPDSKALAWQEPDGVWLKDDPTVCNAPQPRLLIAGAAEPDWSASPVNPGPRDPGTDPGTNPGNGSPAAAPVALVAGKPVVSGKAKVGRRLTAATGTWSPAPASYAFQWLRNGTAISGATAASYKVKAKDRGKKLSVRVTGLRPGQAPQVAVSAPTKVRPKR